MKNLLNPRWILIVTTLPQLVLFGLYSGAYTIINSLLTESHLRNWLIYGSILAVFWAASTLYGAILLYRRGAVHHLFGLLLLLAYIPFLYAFALAYRRIIPWTIPRWMLFHGDLFISVFTFVMPSLIYGLIIVIAWMTPDGKSRRAWKNFAAALAIPLSWYFLSATNTLFMGSRAVREILPFVCIISTVAFLFLLLRAVYIILAGRDGAARRNRLWLVLPVSFIFPLLGLALHNGHLIKNGFPTGILGDFSHPAFYYLAALNGLLLCLPSPKGRCQKLLLMTFRAAALPFTLYFFFVFLPFFPLSIIAVIAMGTGFLMLTPLVLLPIHLSALHVDFVQLKSSFDKGILGALLAAAFLILPLSLGGTYLRDRAALHHVLDYVYEPDYSLPGKEDFNMGSIKRVLDTVRDNNSTRRIQAFGGRTPYLTPLYQYVVLDNLTLSNRKISQLEQIFFGASEGPPAREAFSASDPETIYIEKAETESSAGVGGQSWKTTVHLEIRNESSGTQEFATRFSLPEGAWISDFYLFVGDRKEKGLLAERKSALWVYRQITSTRRDPGILYYMNGSEIAFRVFPFSGVETRKAGFTILHREPATLSIDGKEVRIGPKEGRAAPAVTAAVAGGSVLYVPAASKARLPRFSREPYYHFVIDCSRGTKAAKDRQIRAIKSLLVKQLIPPSRNSMTMAGFRSRTLPMEARWEDILRREPEEGGFFLERSLKELLLRRHGDTSRRYPIVVIVTDSLERAIFTGNLTAFSGALPESDLLYLTKSGGKLEAFSIDDIHLRASRGPVEAIPRQAALAYPDAEAPLFYLPDNGEASIVLSGSSPGFSGKLESYQSWENALALEGMWRWLEFHPEELGEKKLPLVKRSFSSRIMTPATSYIVVENEAQKAALLAKQKMVLKAKNSFDLDGGTFEAMPEPPWWIILLSVSSILAVKGRKGRNSLSGGHS